MTSYTLQRDWEDRFRAFAARKQGEARSAQLAPFITEIDGPGPGLVPMGDGWSRRLFDGPFYVSDPSTRHDLPSTSLVFVQSRDGNTGASDPSALGGGATDKHLIYEGLSRVAADAVLVGADTIRGGNIVFSVWREEMIRLRDDFGKPRHPVQVVATLRGMTLDDGLLFNVPDLPVVVLTVQAAVEAMRQGLASRPWITPIVMAHTTDLVSAFRALRGMGIERMSAVGGRTIADAMLDAGLVQDLYLTTSPQPGGIPNTPLYPRPLDTDLVLRKHGTGADEGVMFEHVKIRLKPDTTG